MRITFLTLFGESLLTDVLELSFVDYRTLPSFVDYKNPVSSVSSITGAQFRRLQELSFVDYRNPVSFRPLQEPCLDDYRILVSFSSM